MFFQKRNVLFVTLTLLLMANQCPKDMDASTREKIDFEYSTIDDKGLRHGGATVDYEFCIPADDARLQEILKIAPEVKVMQKSKGRIGCREGQWLLINSTRYPEWKKVLYAIAKKDFVIKIIETHYE